MNNVRAAQNPRIKPHETDPQNFQQKSLASSNDFVHIEKNLASLGFFTPSTKKIKGSKKKTILFSKEVDGKKVELRAVILPSAEYGLPITADQDKFLALQKIIADIRHQKGMVSNPIGFTSAELLRILGLKVNAGKNYGDILEWAKRMTLTGISSEGVVYLAGKQVWASDTFHVFERFVSFGKEMPDGTIADKNYIWLSEWQLENINSNHLLPIDLETYKQLKNHISKALVPLLQIWLYATRAGGCFEKRYHDLCQILNIRQYPNLSRIKEKLAPSLEELKSYGYLANWKIEKTSSGANYKIALYHGEKFHRDQRRRLAQCGPGLEKKAPVETLQDNDHLINSEVHSSLLEEMVKRGIGEATAGDLLRNCTPGQPILDQLEWGDFLIRQAPRGKFYNPAGLYIHLVRENLILPESFESSQKRQLREALQQAREDEESHRLRLELAYSDYKKELIDRHIQRNFSKEHMRSWVQSKRLELLEQDKRLKDRWNEQTLQVLAENKVRSDIAKRLSIMTFPEFCKREQRKQQRAITDGGTI